MMPEHILAIESAISGGSLALIARGRVIRSWAGAEGSIARSEELLPRIDAMLAGAGVGARDLKRIAVAKGPGSFTGLRIGIATAMGLSRALKIPCVGVSTLCSIGRNGMPENARIAVVPLGRGGYSWAHFPPDDRDGFRQENVAAGKSADLLTYLVRFGRGAKLVAHSDAFAQLSIDFEAASDTPELIDAGRDTAIFIGRDSDRFDEGLQPIYPLAGDRDVSPKQQ